MILGMSLATFTAVHTAISILGIVTGVPVMYGLLKRKRLDGWTAVFLASNVATSVTGFFFPIHKFGPPHYVGILSLIVLAIALLARYAYKLAGGWRRAYVISAVIALYLNTFVGIVQAFGKIPALHALAPLGNEPPFALAQGAVLVMFIAIGFLATSRFHPEAVPAVSA
jgi:uncharacterized membrane protein YraQ (UPF0718 family)